MYRPIQLSDHRKLKSMTESTSLDIFNENKEAQEESIFTEAVFINGKEKIAPILEKVTVIKNELEAQLKAQNKSSKNAFDPKAFWRSPNIRALEDNVRELFGFRFVSIEPYIEKYNSFDNTFESKELNCMVYRADRYPIDGVVTDKGFYDGSHSLVMNVYITLGLLHALEPEEITAVFLHEFGHNIDPAVMTIKYAETNILSKYITDRNSEYTDSEKKVAKSKLNLFAKVKNIFSGNKQKGEA